MLLLNLTGESTALYAALAAFIAATVILLVFVVLLFACKPFRAFFFRPDDGKKQSDKQKKKKTPTKKTNAAKKPSGNGEIAQNNARKSGEQPRKTRVRLAYSDSVPTVPLFVAPKTTSSTQDEDIMKRTHEALMAMSSSKPRATKSTSGDYVPTIVIPVTDSRDKSEPVYKTGERSYTTHERLAANVKKTNERAAVKPTITAKPTATKANATKPTANKPTATKPTITAKPATTKANATKPTTAKQSKPDKK